MEVSILKRLRHDMEESMRPIEIELSSFFVKMKSDDDEAAFQWKSNPFVKLIAYLEL